MEDLFSEHGTVEELLFDDEFIGHMSDEARQYGKHKVTMREIRQVHSNAPAYFLNGEGRRAPLIMLGPTDSGRMLVVPLEPTHMHGLWHPVTAFEANRHHVRRYEER